MDTLTGGAAGPSASMRDETHDHCVCFLGLLPAFASKGDC
jgi:hypothetical protein